jgi:predicted nucleic acid-binding Zn ribbon protein
MDCPNCGTWNPDDKNVCWRCQTPLPKPEEKRQRKPFTIFGLPAWMVIVLVLMLFVPLLMQCFGGGGVPGL